MMQDMEIIHIIETSLKKALEKLNLSVEKVHLEHPAELLHGDYATNVAMALAKQAGENPRALAEKIVETLNSDLPKEISKVEVAGPGFINFFLSKDFYQASLKTILEKGSDFGKNSTLKGKKVLVEHSSPNLFKPFHIGHFMNNAIGESLARMAQFSGAELSTMTFPSDISLGVAKAVFVLLEEQGEDFEPKDVSVLGDAYVAGTKRYDEDDSIQARVKEIADNLYAEKNSPEWTLYQKCKAVNIEDFKTITARLGSHFDSFIFESEAGVTGKEIVLENTPAVFTESEGAIVYIPEEEKKHINTAVFINSQGNPTYEAKDIGLIDLKFEKINPDLSLFVTDYQQTQHFSVVLDAAHKINSAWEDRVCKSLFVPHGRMSFKGQKMSSRLGGVPLIKDLIQVVLDEIAEKTKEQERAVSKEDADAVAIGALKFAVLRSKPGQNINFDPETSLSFEGDSGPYLQYTRARTVSLLEKAHAGGLSVEGAMPETWEVTKVEALLYRFPEIVELAVETWEPHHIVGYIVELAQAFNSWYGNTQIIVEGDAETPYRLAVTQAVGQVMRNGLKILGIEAPEKM